MKKKTLPPRNLRIYECLLNIYYGIMISTWMLPWLKEKFRRRIMPEHIRILEELHETAKNLYSAGLNELTDAER